MPQMPTSRALPAGEAELSPTLTYHLVPSVVGQQHRLGRFHTGWQLTHPGASPLSRRKTRDRIHCANQDRLIHPRLREQGTIQGTFRRIAF